MECKFDKAWIGKCKQPTVEGTEYCTDHLIGSHHDGYNKSACCQCGEQATHDCAETFQLVCGAPLCDKEECKIKHHPNHFRLTAKRWAELYKTEVPVTSMESAVKIEYSTFRTNLLRQPVKQLTKTIADQLEGHAIEGVEKVYGFGDMLVVRFDNGMTVRFKADL